MATTTELPTERLCQGQNFLGVTLSVSIMVLYSELWHIEETNLGKFVLSNSDSTTLQTDACVVDIV